MNLESLKQKIPLSVSRRGAVLLDRVRRLMRNPMNDLRIRQAQERLIRENYSSDTDKLVVFLTPGRDIVNGGILSISSIYGESRKLKHVHGADVVLCTIPGDPLLLRYTKFNNTNYVYGFPQVLAYFKGLQCIIVHIPELCIAQFNKSISKRDRLALSVIPIVHINIMLQNIELLPPMKHIEELSKLGIVTCTTAHEQYTTRELRARLRFPVHKLSAWVSPEQYDKKHYREKEELLIVSPDAHPRKSEVLNIIAGQLPRLRIQIIRNLTYEEFKDVISRAKWALTFGEGLDGYFLETIFSGGVSFAVYNARFFTDDFKPLRTAYDSYDMLSRQICADMNDLDNEASYSAYQQKQYEVCCKHYNYKQYVKNLELFYKGEYTYK